jgi:hypothetical protein
VAMPPHLPLFSLMLQDPTATAHDHRSASPLLNRYHTGRTSALIIAGHSR